MLNPYSKQFNIKIIDNYLKYKYLLILYSKLIKI